MKPNFTGRKKKLRSLMRKNGMDAILTSNRNDVFYYTGYAGLREDRTFMVFPADGNPILIATPLENEVGEKYPKFVVMDDINDFIKQVKPFKRLGYDERDIKIPVYNELGKLKIDLKPAGKVLEIPRMIKEPYEIQQIKNAVRITKRVFGKVGNNLTGKMEKDIADLTEIEFRKHGVSECFESIVSSGKQGAFVHHRPDERVIGKNDAVLIDIGCSYKMYCSDITRMFFRKLNARNRKVYEDLKEIHAVIIDRLRDGVKYEEIEELHKKMYRKKRYLPVHMFGHGVGLSVHDPVGDVIKRGMVLTVEPGIYVKNLGGFRLEDMVLIKKGKTEVLSKSIPIL